MKIKKLRPHHLLCIEGFKGLGYSRDFVENMKMIISELKKGKKFIIVKGVDDICMRCPYCDGIECRNSYGLSVGDMDNNVMDRLGILENVELDYSKIRKKIYRVFQKKNDLDGICDGCRWNSVCNFYRRFLIII